LVARHAAVTVDLGTGDGRAVLAAAATQPDRLVVGVDASAAAMAEASRRAGRRPGRGGLPNALFVLAAAEALPGELEGVAELVTVQFPWGSLLRGLLDADPRVMGGLAGLLVPGGTLRLLVSSTDRDRGARVEPITEPTLYRLAGAWETYGLAIAEVRPATWADVAAAHSSWGKRLGAGRWRPAWLLRAGRAAEPVRRDERGGNRERGADRVRLGMDRRGGPGG
jgi:16S rRNA (adenine(1408)-N(1))-methyltransferase